MASLIIVRNAESNIPHILKVYGISFFNDNSNKNNNIIRCRFLIKQFALGTKQFLNI